MKSYKAILTAFAVLLVMHSAYGAEAVAPVSALSAEDFSKAKALYFNRCAGCHGTLRKGATGPNITDENLIKKSYNADVVKIFITNGTPGGMPSFGTGGELSEADIGLLANFLMQPPPAPPELGMAEIKESWNLIIPEAQRPKKPEHTRNWKNFFGIVLRDAGKVAILDGDTKEVVNIVDTGFAVHIHAHTRREGGYAGHPVRC